MLHNFLEANRAEILKLVNAKVNKLHPGTNYSEEFKRGIPLFFDDLIGILKTSDSEKTITPSEESGRVAGTHRCQVKS